MKQRPAEPTPADELETEPDDPPGKRGVTFSLDEGTKMTFNRLRATLASEGIKVNDSLILRTALDLVPEDGRQFIERARALKRRDGASVNGKTVGLWFDEEDRQKLRELRMWLAGHELEASHSLIVRAMLRAIPKDERLLDAIRDLLERDGRRVRHRKAL